VKWLKACRNRVRLAYLHHLRRHRPERHAAIFVARIERDMGANLVDAESADD
jgi:hypothetical protein